MPGTLIQPVSLYFIDNHDLKPSFTASIDRGIERE